MATKTTKQNTGDSPDVIKKFKAVKKAYKVVLEKKYGYLALINKIDELGGAIGIKNL